MSPEPPSVEAKIQAGDAKAKNEREASEKRLADKRKRDKARRKRQSKKRISRMLPRTVQIPNPNRQQNDG